MFLIEQNRLVLIQVVIIRSEIQYFKTFESLVYQLYFLVIHVFDIENF